MGIKIDAGDRPYIPAGAFQFWINADGTTGSAATLAVDPWLPDVSVSGGTPTAVVDDMIRQGFPVSSICTRGTINACQKSHGVRELVANPETTRIRHLAVIDGKQACRVLDLDKARGQVEHDNPHQGLLAGDICQPLGQHNVLRADSPLMDYLLTADERPFRLVQLPGNRLGTVDVEDLQRLPVRVLLFIKFSHLETLLARQLCAQNPKFLKVERIVQGHTSQLLGNSGSGPERRIERLLFRELLAEAKSNNLITIGGKEMDFLNRYRNNVAHGPRWYITRRADVEPLVNCVKQLSRLIDELDAVSR